MAVIVVAGLRRESSNATAFDTPRIDFVLQCRYAVGAHRSLPTTGTAPSMLAGIDEAAKSSPANQLLAATIAGEIDGDNAALSRLDAISLSKVPDAFRHDVARLRTLYEKKRPVIGMTADERAGLIARYGWFARLALSHGKPDDDPDRRAVLRPAMWTFWTALGIVALGGIGTLIGMVLLVLAIVLRVSGGLTFAYRPPPRARDGPFVEAFAVYMLGMLLISLLGVIVYHARGNVPLLANLLLGAAVPPAVLWLRFRGLTWAEIRAGLGWHIGRGVAREMAWGVVGYIAGLPILAVTLLMTSLLARLSGTTPTHPIVQEAAGASGVIGALQLYLIASLYAPLAEETMFRGALYHHVRRHMPWWLSAMVVGILFASIHPQGWVGIPMLAGIAFVFAMMREWRGSILASMVVHACVNGVSVTMLLLMTR